MFWRLSQCLSFEKNCSIGLIGAVCGQEEQVRASVPDGLPDGFSFVAAEIVQDHHIAGLQGWNQRLLDSGAETLTIDWPVEQERGVHAVAAQGGDEGIGSSAVMRHLTDQPLPALAPSPEGRHVGLGPGFINEDQTAPLDAFLMAAPAGAAARDIRPVLLRGEGAFF